MPAGVDAQKIDVTIPAWSKTTLTLTVTDCPVMQIHAVIRGVAAAHVVLQALQEPLPAVESAITLSRALLSGLEDALAALDAAPAAMFPAAATSALVQPAHAAVGLVIFVHRGELAVRLVHVQSVRAEAVAAPRRAGEPYDAVTVQTRRGAFPAFHVEGHLCWQDDAREVHVESPRLAEVARRLRRLAAEWALHVENSQQFCAVAIV